MGGTILPGASAITMIDLVGACPTAKPGTIIYENGAMAVPNSQIPEAPPASAKTSLEELDRRGEFLPPVTKSGLIGFVHLAAAVGKDANRHNVTREYQSIFSRREGRASVFVNWQPTKKAKGKTILRVFNADNQKLAESKPQNVSLSPGDFLATSWDVPLQSLEPAIYRVDLLFGEQIIWRDFFRVTD
jgi:hypothetical protein